MTGAVQHILDSFKELSEAEKHELAVEILRRTVEPDSPHLSDDDLVLSAEALFLDLDRVEAQYDQP
jgi:hypothetical protein